MTEAPHGDESYAAVVVGSGIAGLVTALHLAEHGPVALVTKATPAEANTAWAQGGLAAAIGEDDSPTLHYKDTIAAGAGLVDPRAARVLCDEAAGVVDELLEAGVAFDLDDSRIALGREAAHQRNRIVHAGGDRSGLNIEEALLKAIRRTTVRVLAGHTLSRLTRGASGVAGVELLNPAGEHVVLEAGATVLATGGAGRLYSHTTNPDVATGDGIAVAFEAGAMVADLEFFQFHPTAFRMAGHPPFLISEAVRGEGAILRATDGRRFMPGYDRQAELAPRDVVARAITREMRRTGADHVLLDCSGIRGVDLRSRFPAIHAFCLAAGIEMEREGIPVAPAAHYYMGGVLTDIDGRTSVPGLYAVGEVACTGVHGANRLASNSLVEGGVFGRRAAAAIARKNTGWWTPPTGAIASAGTFGVSPSPAELQALMWDVAGIERDEPGLRRGLATMATWPAMPDSPAGRAGIERRSLSVTARLVVEAALRRTESRGAHYRSDYPQRDDRNWQRRQVFYRGD